VFFPADIPSLHSKGQNGRTKLNLDSARDVASQMTALLDQEFSVQKPNQKVAIACH